MPSRHKNIDNRSEDTEKHCVKHLATMNEQLKMDSLNKERQ